VGSSPASAGAVGFSMTRLRDEVLDWRTRLRDTAIGQERAGMVTVGWFDRMVMKFQVEGDSQAVPGQPIPEDVEPEDPEKK